MEVDTEKEAEQRVNTKGIIFVRNKFYYAVMPYKIII
jgi:hypothetical protein